ncbi:hypothetical protein MD588_19005 [Photobacterium sp. SDRW27]|uniref:hypothetical protein n=1 Tax=Photobacterium obscurum TaxID=2829490 RepID=UPI0022441C3D|nr:hypothetical protein [Photobacterium obscurum]MCW8330886.1 hypothetical protein [Photobacterium obscurum]
MELEKITAELQQELDKAKGNMFIAKVVAPLRLVLVWMNGVNQKLMELEQGGKHG